jgi:hypothetical protein
MNKKAQIGETMTWIVATIIIAIILIITILLASSPGIKHKELPYTNNVDLFADKSLSAYLLTKDSGGATVYTELSNGEVNDFNKNLANEIFVGLYSGYYTYLIFSLTGSSKPQDITTLITKAGASPSDLTVHSYLNYQNKNLIGLEMSHRT